jgi:predicted ATP-dependent serine protease
MAYSEPTGQRKPMSDEARANIANAVRAAAAKKREGLGLPPISHEQRGNYIPSQSDFIDKAIELVKMKDQNFDPDIFIPMKTDKAADYLFTDNGGVPKACNFMVIGDPGVGKTTLMLDILSDLALAGYRTLFISAEMSRIDLYGYVQRFPKFGEVEILFTGEYCDSNPKTIFENALKPGYDVVLIDSFVEVQEDIKEALRMSTIGSEKMMIDIMLGHNLGGNELKKHTTFLVIQQVTKGGVFVGTNKLKHNTTGMLEIRMDVKSSVPYLMFNKNRRGSAGKKMYYSLAANGDVEYDLKRFNNDENARTALVEEKAELEKEGNTFDSMFGAIDEIDENSI